MADKGFTPKLHASPPRLLHRPMALEAVHDMATVVKASHLTGIVYSWRFWCIWSTCGFWARYWRCDWSISFCLINIKDALMTGSCWFCWCYLHHQDRKRFSENWFKLCTTSCMALSPAISCGEMTIRPPKHTRFFLEAPTTTNQTVFIVEKARRKGKRNINKTSAGDSRHQNSWVSCAPKQVSGGRNLFVPRAGFTHGTKQAPNCPLVGHNLWSTWVMAN